MAQPAAIKGNVGVGGGPPPLPAFATPAGPVFCHRCSADVARLPPAARFCNRCGSVLPAPPSPSPAAAPQRAETCEPPPDILLAYARALFNLGCRYENAVGSRRNLAEAARCYWKAARLGDAPAAGRFPPSAFEVPVLPYLPPPLPPPAA